MPHSNLLLHDMINISFNDGHQQLGDALLEIYDGDFRGVYLNVELSDGMFQQFGLFPTDLFAVDEEW
jgi:hypothetical protein